MSISVFELFKIGIGPSSSHTVGPMKAANAFLALLKQKNLLNQGKLANLRSELYGSLALTGLGHGTDKAVILGLEGCEPKTVEIDRILPRFREINKDNNLKVNNEFTIAFNKKTDLVFHKKKILPYHTNGMKFSAFDENNNLLLSMNYYSVGGGFFLSEDDVKNLKIKDKNPEKEVKQDNPWEFNSGKEAIKLCETHNISFNELVLRSELETKTLEEINSELDEIWDVMNVCIENGLKKEGQLPGPLKVRRRAHKLYGNTKTQQTSLLNYLDYVSAFALSVSEENAAGARVVTSPTNGAAGVVPSVLKYLKTFHLNPYEGPDHRHREFLLVAAGIGILFKKGATISGAEGGCQAEIGSACAMASAGLCSVLGGDVYQIMNSANIGAEHNLGLTCDPIFGLVQVPCIERNSMAAIKAINACNLALRGDGQHIISLDRTIRVLKVTGDDMKDKYKETALGGLAWDFYQYDEDGNKRDTEEKIRFTQNMAEC